MRKVLLAGCALLLLAGAAFADTKPGWDGDREPQSAAGCPGPFVIPGESCPGSPLGDLGTNPVTLDGFDTVYYADNYDAGAGNSCTGYESSGPDAVYQATIGPDCVVDLVYNECPAGPPDSFDRSLYFVTDCNDIAGTCLCGSDQTFPGGPEGPEFCSYFNDTGAPVTGQIVCDGFGGDAGRYTIDVATQCPTPVTETSWGQVKATYNQ